VFMAWDTGSKPHSNKRLTVHTPGFPRGLVSLASGDNGDPDISPAT